MGIRAFFHKIKIGFVRRREASIPYTSNAKKYGNYGENEFTYELQHELPSCKIKRNVLIETPEGDAEIDCLILYQNKLFAIEVKCWKGRIIEQEDGFLQEKTDRWTGEMHTKYLKSPFKQLGRAVYLLRKQISINAWINTVVFFEDDELESVSIFSDIACFDRLPDLINYIRNDGKASFGECAHSFFDKCIPADFLFNGWESLRCLINRDSLQLHTPNGIICADSIATIRIIHHWSYDELHITLTDGAKLIATAENAKIQVNDNGYIRSYALCKLDYIELGRTLN